ncbi:MAG: histidine phosphatase family protein [Anaerolineae bacterium]
MQLYFIRHGQSENNALWTRTGSSDGRVSDPALTEVGERQAELVARFLARSGVGELAPEWDPQNVSGFEITHVYSSLMERAVATGHEIAQALNLPLRGWLDLHETGGMFLYDEETDTHVPQPGKSRSYLETHFPRIVLPETVTEEGWWNRPFEPREARMPRAQRVLEELLVRHSGTDHGVILVSHGGFFNYLLRAVFGLPAPVNGPWFTANNASITRLDFIDGERTVMYVNRVDFLPADLIT